MDIDPVQQPTRDPGEVFLDDSGAADAFHFWMIKVATGQGFIEATSIIVVHMTYLLMNNVILMIAK